MNEYEIYERIKQALSSAPRNQYTAELHLQMIKYADDLKTITAKEFCEGVGLRSSFGTEFSKMRNLLGRLKAAGMDTVERHNRTIRYSLIHLKKFKTMPLNGFGFTIMNGHTKPMAENHH